MMHHTDVRRFFLVVMTGTIQTDPKILLSRGGKCETMDECGAD